jgi:hypothetical protein
MAKRIVFCADGTWNGPEKKKPADDSPRVTDESGEPDIQITNVLKLFVNLSGNVLPQEDEGAAEQERFLVDRTGTTVQAAKYIDGVGASGHLLDKLLGGAFGVGLIGRIVRGYTFISRHYDPGDEIHIVGFSRGAYTARALGGMISSVGLLNRATYDVNDKHEAYRLGTAAWRKYKATSFADIDKLTLADRLVNLGIDLISPRLPENGLIGNVPIKSVGVWDTVGSLGIPVYFADGRYDLYRFKDTALSPKVERGFHAMAIDELRADFPVTRWDERLGVRQVWFAGAHSDVGGGYITNECGLSDVALDWMIRQLNGVGVLFETPPRLPPDVGRTSQNIHEPWAKFPFKALLRDPRQVRATDLLHDSVLKRWQADEAYRPMAMQAFAQSGLGAFQHEN